MALVTPSVQDCCKCSLSHFEFGRKSVCAWHVQFFCVLHTQTFYMTHFILTAEDASFVAPRHLDSQPIYKTKSIVCLTMRVCPCALTIHCTIQLNWPPTQSLLFQLQPETHPLSPSYLTSTSSSLISDRSNIRSSAYMFTMVSLTVRTSLPSDRRCVMGPCRILFTIPLLRSSIILLCFLGCLDS